MKRIPFYLLAGMSLLVACSKNHNNDNPASDPNKEAAAKLQKEVQGKWLFGSDVVLEGGQATQLQQVTTNGTTGTTDANGGLEGFIEFAADSTFIIYDENGKVFTRKFEAKSAESITLEGVGYLTGIKVTDDKIYFILYYYPSKKNIYIICNKTIGLPANDRTALLCKNPWYMTKEEGGTRFLDQEKETTDENGRPVTYIVDSITVLMSANGTFLMQDFSCGKLKRSLMANWTWHPTRPDTFLYKWKRNNEPSEYNHVQATKLTPYIFEWVEFWDDGENNHADAKLVLKPAR